MTAPAWSVQVAWPGNTQGEFVIGTSTIGGTDVIGGAFGAGAFNAITPDVKSIRITRGRPSDLVTMAQGTCTLRLADGVGKYNPQNPTSPLVGLLVPMRPVRVQATYSGVTYTHFYGYISRIESDPNRKAQETIIEAVDLFERLNYRFPVIGAKTNNTTSQLIGAILDAITFTDPAFRNLQAGGDVVPTWSSDGTKSALTLIQDLLKTDLGVVFVDGQGRVTYLTRQFLQSKRAAVGTWDGTVISGLKGSTDVKSIVNSQTVTRTGGVAQTATDTTSGNQYDTRAGSAITSPNLATDAQALNLAAFLVWFQKQPRTPARSVRMVNDGATRLTQQLAREIGDVVTVSEALGGTSFTGLVQSITHDVSSGGLIWQSSYAVQKPAVTAFTIGVSTIGSATDLIGY